MSYFCFLVLGGCAEIRSLNNNSKTGRMSSAASARDLVLTSAALPKKENILKWHLLTLQLYCLEGEIHPFVECQDRIISMLFIPLEKIYPHCTGLLKRVKFPPSRISKTRFPLQWKQGLFIRKNIFLLLFNNKQTKTPKQNKLEKKKRRKEYRLKERWILFLPSSCAA